jgi:hypothetical protein
MQSRDAGRSPERRRASLISTQIFLFSIGTLVWSPQPFEVEPRL